MMTSAMSNRAQAEAAAAEWIARRERDDWSAADAAELQTWIAASMDHRVAWLRLDAAWQETHRLKTLLSSAPAGSVPKPEELRLPFFEAGQGQAPAEAVPAVRADEVTVKNARRPVGRYLALAASVLVVIGVAVTWQSVRAPDYHTGVGALQAVPLSDGSRVTLNTNTNLHVDVTPTERRVKLEQGEAFFEVAKDPSRPFIVSAGDRRVVAVGTQFSVRREGDELRVLVTEGVVRLENAAGSDAAQSQSLGSAASDEMLLPAGTVARADADAVMVRERSVAEVEQLLSWRSGRLIFDKTPLAEAVAEFNRYNTRQVVIEDPRIAAIPVGGNFRATNVDAFVRLIAGDNFITVSQQGDRIILSAVSSP
jgi:transmembrane sensor